MTDKKEYRKIIVGLPLDPKEAFIFKDGKTSWNHYWVERVLDYQGYFLIVLEDVIDNKIGKDGWAINFVPEPVDEPHFTAKIHVDNKENYHIVLAIIKEEVTKDIKLDFYYGGDINAYISH